MTRDHQQPHPLPIPNTLRRAASCGSDATAAATSFFHHSNTVSPSVLSLGVSGATARSAGSSYTSKSALVADEEAELEFSGGGAGRGSWVGGGGGRTPGGGSGDNRKGMGAYYREMLQADPENTLLLINYGKFLHEVEGDLQGAEDCFGRAVLASPADGEALSLYGNLMWEAHRDEQRADGYFQRAVQAEPDDCCVLGSYAHFLWDADEDDDQAGSGPAASSSTAAGNAVMVKAY